MAGEVRGAKSKASSKASGKSKPAGTGPGGKKGKEKSARSGKSPRAGKKKATDGLTAEDPERCEGILCPAAMDNLYYIAHGAADALVLRGFRWKSGKKGKGKKGKGKR